MHICIAFPTSFDQPKQHHNGGCHQPEKPSQEELEDLRRPSLLKHEIPSGGSPQRRQDTHRDGPKEDETRHGHHETPERLLDQVGKELASRGWPVHEEEPAYEGVVGHIAPVKGLDALLVQIKVDDDGLDEPGYEALDDDCHGSITG